LRLTAADTIHNEEGQISSGKELQLIAGQLENGAGQISSEEQLIIKAAAIANQKGVIKSGKALEVASSGAINNQAGQIEAQTGLQLSAQSLQNENGQLVSLDDSGFTLLLTGELNNKGGVIGGNGAGTIRAGQLSNTEGQLVAQDNLAMIIQGAIDNTQGRIAGGKDLQLTAHTIVNEQGNITAGQDLTVTAKRLSSSGQLVAGGDLTVGLEETLVNTGQLQAGQNLDIKGQSVANQGTIQAKKNLQIQAQEQVTNSGEAMAGQQAVISGATLSSSGLLAAGVREDGSLGTSGNLTISTTGAVTATGNTLAGGKLDIRGETIDLMGATTYASDALQLTATGGDITNTAGEMTAGKELQIDGAGSLINTQGSINAEQVTISAGHIENQRGRIQQSGTNDTVITTRGHLDTSSGEIASNGQNVALTASDIINHQGQIKQAGAGKLTMQADGTLDNTNGEIATNGQADITAKQIDNRQGTLFAQRQLEMQANRLQNQEGQLMSKQAAGITAKEIDNGQGILEAAKELRVTTDLLVNDNGTITSLDDSGLVISAGQKLSNVGGLIGSNGTSHISADQLDNTGGQVLAKQNVNIKTMEQLDNSSGILSAGSNLTIQQANGSITNTQGTIQAGSDLTIAAREADVMSGSFAANHNLSIQAQNLASDRMQAGEDLTIQAEEEVRFNGQTQANGQLTIQAKGSVTNSGSLTAAKAVAITSDSLANETNAAITSGGQLQLTQKEVSNQGTIYAKEAAALNVANNLETTGSIASGADVTIRAKTIHSTGTLVAGLTKDATVGNTGNLTLKAEEAVTAGGQNLAGGMLAIEGTTIDLQGAQTASQSASITATAGDIDTRDGSLVIQQNLDIMTPGSLINDQALIKADTLRLTAKNISNQGGILAQVGQKDLNLITGKLDNTGGQIATNSSSLTISASEIQNHQGEIQHAGSGTLTMQVDKKLDNTEGQVISNGQVSVKVADMDNTKGTIFAQRQLELQAQRFTNKQGQVVGKQAVQIGAAVDNTEGVIEAGQALAITGQTLTNDEGTITSLDQSGLQVSIAGKLSNTSGLLGGNGEVTITAGQVDNTDGQVSAKTDLQMESANELTNRKGVLAAGKDLTLTQTSGSLDNEEGILQSGQNLRVTAAGADVSGGSILAGKQADIQAKNLTIDQLQAGTDAQIKTQQDVANTGQVQANGALSINAGGKVTNAGSIVGLEQVSVVGATVTNSTGAAIKSNGQLELKGTEVRNQGTLYAKETVTVQAGNTLTTSGTIASGADVELTATTMDSTGTLLAGLGNDGSVGSTGDLTIAATGDVTATGQNLAGGNLTIQGTTVDLHGATSQANQSVQVTATAGEIDNSDGSLTAKESLDITTKGKLVNDAAIMKAAELKIAAAGIQNRGGVLAQFGQSDLSIHTGELDNTAGQIGANSTNLTIDADTVDNSQGEIQHAGSGTLTIQTNQEFDNVEGQVIGNGQVKLSAAEVDNTKGTIFAQRQLEIQANQWINKQGQIVGKQAVQMATDVDNTSGLIEAGQGLSVTGQSLTNDGGKITSLDESGLNVSVTGKLTNTSGLLGGNGGVTVAAGQVDNTDGQISAKLNLEVTSTTGLMNQDGVLAAGKNLILTQASGILDNEEGILQAGENLTVAANGVDVSGGSMLAGKQATVSARNLTIDRLQAGEDTKFKIEQDFTNRGQVQTNGALSVITGGEVSNAGSMIGLDNVSVTGASVTNAAGAAVKSGGTLEISGTRVSNQGTIYGTEAVTVKADKQLTTTGTIAGSADVELTAENVDATGTLAAGLTTNGAVGSAGDLTLTASKKITAKGQNLAGGSLVIQGVSVDVSGSTTYAGHSVSIAATAGNIDNSGGSLSAKESLTIAAKNKLVNDAADVKANQLQITAGDIDNRGGVIAQYGQSDLTINTGTLDNTDGQIAGNSTNLTLSINQLNNSQGQIQHAGSGELSVHSSGDLVNTDGQVVSNGIMDVRAQNLSNDQGTVSAKENLTITANSLENQAGMAVSNGKVSLDIENGIHNQSGTIEAGKTLTIATKSVNNQNGKLTSLDQSGLNMTVQQDINNRSGLIGGNGAAAITTKSLDNTGGQVLSGANLGITASDGIDNTEGKLAASQDLTIEQEYADLMNSKGVIEAGRNLELKAAVIDNAQGRLGANTDLGLTFHSLHGAGSVNAGRNLSLRVGGDFTNASGNTWQAVNDLSINASGSVTNSGVMEAGKNLAISGQQVTNNAGATLVANDELSITAAGDVTNSGSMFGNDVTVVAANIVNANETAAIAATNSVKLYAANGLENKDGALIYSMGDIDIAGSEVKNGEEYTTRAKSLLNQSANIEADGDIAIYADDVVNKKREFEVEQTVISDEIYPLVEGEWYYRILTDAEHFRIFRDVDSLFKEYLGVKESNRQGYSQVGYSNVENYLLLLGQSGTETKIIKDSPVGKIIAGKNLTFKANKIINDNSWMLAGDNLIASGEVVNKAVSGKSGTVNHYALVGNIYVEDWPLLFVDFYVHALYDEVVEGESTQENITTARFGGGQQVIIDGTSVSNVTVTPASGIGSVKAIDSSGQTNATVVANSSGATVNTGIDSSISGSAVQGPVVGSIGSAGQTGSATVVESGTGSNVSMNVNTNVSGSTVQSANVGDIGSSGQAGSATTVGTSTESSTVTTVHTNVVTDKPAVDTASVESDTSTPNVSQVAASESSTKTGVGTGNTDPGTVAALLPTAKAEEVKPPQTNNGGTITLPQNGLYTVKTDPTASYLIETNPKFANYKTFLSSDYLLDKLNYDPATTIKRLGDGFYEQKLVREQITELTGRVFLNGYDSAEEQYQALLQNGAAAADNLYLQVGVALSAEQQAALTTDLVWLVEQEVSGQKVLVPVVYLSALREGDLTNSGAIISGDKVQINVTGDVTNTGTIQAIESTKIGAANVNNIGGSIDGGQLTQITAGQDILNLSGSISGNDILLTAGNDIISQTYTTTTENKHLSKTTVSDTATISAGNTLTAVAGQDLTLLGTKISAGSDINLSAQNINLGVVTDTDHLRLIKVTEEVSNLGTTITAGGNLNLQASQDMNIQAAKLSAGEDLTLMAGNNLQLAAVANSSTSDYNINAYNFNNQATITNQLSSLQAGSALTMVSGSDMTLTGVQAAGNTITALSGGDLTLSSVTDSDFSDVKNGGSRNYQRNMTYDETVIGTNLAATGDITLGAIDSITMAGSSAISEEGGITLNAGKDITIEAVTEEHEALTESKKTKSGFLSKKTTTERDYALLNEVVGSTISGETVDISTGNDLTVKASNIVATNDLNLTAGNDLTITSMAETGAEDHYSYTKKSGLFSGGGLGFTIGSKSEKLTVQEKTLAEIGSTIGSIAGDVTLTAGNQLTSSGANISAGLDLDITGKTVTIDNTINTYDSTTKFEVKQSGLSVSLGGTVVNKGLDAVNSIERAGQVADERLQALYAYKAYDDIKDLSKIKNSEDLKQSVNVSVSVGSSKSTSEQTVHMEMVNTSNISAGQTVTITATGDDVNLTGTKIDAKDITIQAVGDINLDAAQNQQQTTSNSKNSSWGVGVQLGTGIFGSISKGSSKENGTTTTNSGSNVTASDTLTLLSGNDTNIIGSKVTGDKVVAEISGNLTIASLQDIDNYSAKTTSSGLSAGIGQGVMGSYSKGKTNSNYQSVTDQAGIYAGEGGFDIEVGGNTDLKGAVIASDATPDKNKLSTDTLTYSDIQNKADYSASSIGVNINTGKDAEKKDAGLTPNIGGTASGDADSTTKSAISPGTIEVRSNPDQDLSNLSRDTNNSLNVLGKIFDKKTVQEQQELAKVFGEEVFKVVGNLKLKEGSSEKAAIDFFVGGLMAKLGGGDFLSGAASGGITQLVMKELANIKDPALLQWASAVVGAAAAKVVGGNAQTGASIAASETKNNFLTHEQYAKYQQEKKDLKDKLDNESITKEEYDKAVQDVDNNWSDKDKEQEQKWYSEHQTTIDNINKDPGIITREKVGVKLDGTDDYLSPGVVVIGTNPGIIETFIYDPNATATENAHKLLSIGGFTPIAPISEGANAIIYFAEGDNESAAMSAFAAIPGMKVLVVAKGAIKLVPETEAAVKFVQSYTKEVKAGENVATHVGDVVTGASKAESVIWKGFSNGKLKSHYEKHVVEGKEFGKISQSEYLKKAKEFATESSSNFQEAKVGNFNVKYDPETRRVFVGHEKSREIRTFYKADSRDVDPFQAAIKLAKELSGK
jgi:filamentous hemagglutinin